MYRSVTEFGVIGDGKTDNTACIQKAIDETSKLGEVLYFPAGTYRTGTFFLKSNLHMHLTQMARIEAITDLDAYSTDIPLCVEAPSFSKCLLHAQDVDNIIFSGTGTIDGMGQEFDFGDRPMLMRFINCTNINFRDVTFKGAGSWCCHMISCTKINIDNVTIFSQVQNNNDGFDLDGCVDVRISNCSLDTSDDSICLKSTTERMCENVCITNCNITSHTGTIKLGTSSRGGFRNVVMSNCTFYNCRKGTIKLFMVDGGTMDSVCISNIVMKNVASPLCIRLGVRNLEYKTPAEMEFSNEATFSGDGNSQIKNIMISNIMAEVTAEQKERRTIVITGVEGKKIQNVHLSNFDIKFIGGGTADEKNIIVPEIPCAYPEQLRFGVLPAWGLFARHIEQLNLSNINLYTTTKDERYVAVFDDVDEVNVLNNNFEGCVINDKK